MPVPVSETATATQQAEVGHLKLRGHHAAPETTAYEQLDRQGVSTTLDTSQVTGRPVPCGHQC